MHYLRHAVKTDISHADNFAKVDRFSTFFHLQTQQQTLNELTIKDPTIPGYTTLRNLNVQQEAQLMLTNLRDEFGGHSRSPNIVPFHMLGIVSYCAIVTSTSKNFVTLKWGSKVTQGHWEWYHSIDCVWFAIRSPSSISVPNLKQISPFVQKL